ncbi:MAG: low temperature requirement protein A [Pseudonocardiaceae bacterium]|nr:low temperature requirement protein A [Pseudonocardiaceae bacterium]
MPAGRAWRWPMLGRGTDESDRAATPLELFFDLCFVVAVAQAAGQLHHALAEDHAATGLVSYLTVFFSIWWAWMNFTWFASAYDNDDVPYRVATLVQITGALILAAGVSRAFEHHDFDVVFLGYAVMRLGLIAMWLRAAYHDLARRKTALRYAVGLIVVMAGWSVMLLSGHWPLWGWWLMAAAELAVPIVAERVTTTPWHPHHIAERYGLFTIIVLGETVLASASAVRAALDEQGASGSLFAITGGGLLIVFSLWWVYFSKPAHDILVSNRIGFVWGYGHYFIFASAGAVGAGLAVNVDYAVHAAHISGWAAGATVTVPVAVFLLVLWLLQLRPHHTGRAHQALPPVTAVLVLASTITPQPVLVTGVLLAALVGAGTASAPAQYTT